MLLQLLLLAGIERIKTIYVPKCLPIYAQCKYINIAKVSKSYNHKDVERFVYRVYAIVKTHENFFHKATILLCSVVIP